MGSRIQSEQRKKGSAHVPRFCWAWCTLYILSQSDPFSSSWHPLSGSYLGDLSEMRLPKMSFLATCLEPQDAFRFALRIALHCVCVKAQRINEMVLAKPGGDGDTLLSSETLLGYRRVLSIRHLLGF